MKLKSLSRMIWRNRIYERDRIYLSGRDYIFGKQEIGMILAKQIADLLTFILAFLVIPFILLGMTRGAMGLQAAVWLLLFAWLSDVLDGPIARRSRVKYSSWIGEHDLQADMAVSVGLLVYMLMAGYASWWVGTIYTLLWALILWRWNGCRSLGMLFQAPIYGWFLLVVLLNAPAYGLGMILWLVAIVVATWPRFHKEVVPDFLSGFKEIRNSEEHSI